MLPQSNSQLSQKVAAQLGLPDGFKLYSSAPFGGMNTLDDRTGIEDPEFSFLENLIHLGKNKVRSLWDQGASIYTAPTGKTIVSHFFYNIQSTDYAVAFLSDGTAVQVNVITKAVTTISATPNLFYNGGQLPATSQWGSQYLLIANNLTVNDYWIWDGSVFYSPGSLGPTITLTSGGSGYSSPPTVTAFGGLGSGATFQANTANGSVVSVDVLNPGMDYEPGDMVQLVFSGGGSDNGAKLMAVLSAGTIGHVEIIDPGSGGTPGTYALGISGGGGSGAAGTYTIGAGGTVDAILITSGGSGYTGTPTITFPSGSVVGAVGLAILNPGSIASVTVVDGGTGFTSTPTLSVQGGGGSGAVLVAVLTGQSISSVTVTNGGTGFTSVPAINVQSGINNAASGTASLMPFGVSGSSMETFDQRVWLPFPDQSGSKVNGNTFLVSAPESLTDFATSDGGLTYTNTSALLRKQYVNIKQSNGYLYPFGDSSVDVISNVQTSGSPTTTTFNYQNTDPQTGTSWRDSVSDYYRTLIFANKFGVFGLYGGAVTKVSDKMDDIFQNAIFPPNAAAVLPSSAVANIYEFKVYLLLMTIMDPFTGLPRNVMIGWNQKDWFVASQSTKLTYISTQEVSSNLTAWGTDGTNLFPLFATPSASITKTLQSKLYGAETAFVIKQAFALYLQAQDKSSDLSGVAFNGTIDTDGTLGKGLVSFPLPNGTINLKPKAGGRAFTAANPGDIYGYNLGFTLNSTSKDFILDWLGLGYVDTTALFGSDPMGG